MFLQNTFQRIKLTILLYVIAPLNIIQIQMEKECNPRPIIILHLQGQRPYVETEHIALAKAVGAHAHIMVELQNG